MDIYQCLEYWYGLEELGLFREKTKKIKYNSQTTDALQCFSGTTASTCAQSTCRWVSPGQCLPNEHESEWWIKQKSRINSRSTGVVNTLVDDVEVDIREDLQVRVSILKPTLHVNHILVVFPSGYPYRIPQKSINGIVTSIIKQTQDFPSAFVVMCGHSMGAVWAQEIAVALSNSSGGSQLLDRVHVVGSGAFIWAYKTEVRQFVDRFKGRFFFMAATAMDTNKIQKIDSTVFEVFEASWCGSDDNSERSRSSELCSFPTHLFDVLHHRVFTSEVIHCISQHGFVAGPERYSFKKTVHPWSDYPVKFGGWGKSSMLNTKIHEWAYYRNSLRRWLSTGHVMHPLKPEFLDRESQDLKCNQKHSFAVQSIRKNAYQIKLNESLEIKIGSAGLSWFLVVPFDRKAVHQYFDQKETLTGTPISKAMDRSHSARTNQPVPISILDMDENSFYLLQQKITNPFWLFTPHPKDGEYHKKKEFDSLSDFFEYLLVEMKNPEYAVYSTESNQLIYQSSQQSRKRSSTHSD